MIKIFIDAGHGGKDGGAAANGIKESEVVLDIAKRIEKGLQNYENIDVLMSRTTDSTLTLEQRTDKANSWGADVLVSVHVNAANTAARGFESFIFPNAGGPTVAFQNVMHQEILRSLGTGIIDRGKKQKNFHMLRESNMKAILTENLFLTNSADAALLKNDQFKQRIADGHIVGLEKFLGLRKKSTEPPREKPTKLYKVQVAAFEDKERAEAVVADLIRLGYKPMIKYE